MNYSTEKWKAVLSVCGVGLDQAQIWAPYFSECVVPDAFSKWSLELPDFTGQILHESNHLQYLSEILNYKSAARLCTIWPTRFPTLDSAQPYVGKPQLLAAKVYGGRMGNQNANDAWNYRGGGLIMITGKDNYALVEAATGLPLVQHPELLRVPGVAPLKACIAWWEKRVPDSVMGNVLKVTRAVNGGTIGYAERVKLTARVAEVLEAP